ncbi:precorrin-6y C5,15-methyltransferase (decarboxylating) subunit CbiE [Lichenihabitans sp. Uapishka_5]|uniref:precorrin-6y C5,15-methyltransferase (decarboxylating) subunit CbiE n=1 Tax=Lichenihabitans sp. Uapishka_5 TaxID=3037302 RepID=UPI0029E7FD09|nr:precorrin-6y C5,15-methyltransferase (decarboxylating) subunit CbiE [Lichenihabitans sp. Uapishka_5]MDX7950680.1 precorrin-6y C5,15-methyltransferase (decarboxylating) subunit CbiE [Lichenihabitans sp. Uapishka_5]
MSDGVHPWLSLVGLGEDGPDGLSPAARTAIEAAALVVGGARHLALAGSLIRGEALCWRSPLESTLPDILARQGQPICVLATGDPFHYGVGALLARHIPVAEMRCWPQPSAFSLMAARLGWSLEACRCLSVHGRALGRVVPALRQDGRLIALSWDGDTPARLAALLVERGFGASLIVVGEALGGPAERLRHTTAAGFDLDGVQALNTVACALVAEPGARQRPATPGLPDDWFAHDGQITKAPIRAMTLAALAPRPGEQLWDVGAGSGSVGIEWLLSDDATQAVAVERDAGRADRVAANAAHWGVADRLTLVRGAAPTALAELPPPDAAFIGGGLTEPGLMDAVQMALPAGGRLVANAVTLESQALLMALFGHHGGDLVSLGVARAEPVGAFHGFRPAMPVVQWRWVKP